ncbi:hypothetical protein NE865_16441 [Phthorimaea operculella]|nr:hypothetical protein NE865_16441 [Phthorimaea operculella]
MQNSARIKTETCTQTICQVCLSSNRKINVLGELSDVFRLICFNTTWDVSSNIFICWECRSVLWKTKKFQEKVAKARIVLDSYVGNENQPLTSLSNLNITKPLFLDIDGTKETHGHEEKFIFDVPFEVKKIEPSQDVPPKISEIKIKEENETEYNDNFDNTADFDNFEFGPMEVVKDENLPDTLKELSGIKITKIKSDILDNQETTFKRTQHYKMIHYDDKEIIKNGRESLKKHHRRFHEKKRDTLQCKICQKWLPSDTLKAHIADHYFYYLCTTCKYSCYTLANMRWHLRKHTKVVQCLHCDANFGSTREFFPHYKTYHTIFICDHCGRRYTKKELIVRHITKNHSVYKCVECDLTFASYRVQRQHVSYKHQIEREKCYCVQRNIQHHAVYKCAECDLTFASYRVQWQHISYKHQIERSEECYCVPCNIQFDNVLRYKKHLSTAVVHLKEMKKLPKRKSVKCPECPNVYTRKAYMVNHYRVVHSKNYRFYCNICQKGLLNSTRFKQHMAYVHEGRMREKNKICYVCGRGFYDNRILENHMRTHTGERPFGCAHCDAKFTQKVALDSHVKFIHMKNKRKPADDMKKMMDSFGTQFLGNKCN